MNDATSPTLILAVPGSHETQELSRPEVLRAIKRGEIGLDYWVWSHSENDWKRVAEIPELQFTPEEEEVPAPPMNSSPVVVAPARTPQPRASTTYSRPIEIEKDFPILEVFFAITFLILFGIIIANYIVINSPLNQALALTPFKSVRVYAHLGGFVQPDTLVIHVLPDQGFNSSNFADFLAVLAKRTPLSPFTGKPFGAIGLSSSWRSQYMVAGTDWQQLGAMETTSSGDKEKFVTEHFIQMNGASLVYNRRRDDATVVATHEAKAWQALFANFLPKISSLSVQ